MKTHRLLIATTALLFAAVPSKSSAAEVTVDIVSIAPRNPDAVIAQIELNVLLKQYEKLLTQIEDAILQRELENESIPSDATEDQKKQAEERHVKQNKDRDRESRALQDQAHQCRARIKEIMSDANKRAAAFEKEQREAKQTTGQIPSNSGTLVLTPGQPGTQTSATMLYALASIAADPKSDTLELTARDSITASVTGRLTKVWDSGKLFYASAKAGGTEIELDPAGCPDVTRELLDFVKTQGGGFISSVEVRATGDLIFEKRPQSVKYRETSRNNADAIMPTLKVHSLKIVTLPLGDERGSIKRDRDLVKSTTIGVTKR